MAHNPARAPPPLPLPNDEDPALAHDGLDDALAPNELKVTLVRGRRLMPMDKAGIGAKLLGGGEAAKPVIVENGKAPPTHAVVVESGAVAADGGTSDAFVTMSVGAPGVRAKSGVAQKTLEPCWKERFSLPLAFREGAVLTLRVDDYDLASGNDFMGACKLRLRDLGDDFMRRRRPARRWVDLEAEDGETAARRSRTAARSSSSCAGRTTRGSSRPARARGREAARGR